MAGRENDDYHLAKRKQAWVSHRAAAIKCAKEQVRLASRAKREMRETMVRRLSGTPESRKAMEPSPREQDFTGQQPSLDGKQDELQ